VARSSVNASEERHTTLARRMLEHGWEFHLQVSEAEALDLASGCVPLQVQAQARAMLDWIDADRRNAERPYPKHKRNSKRE